ncbi:MAG: 2-[(L-alanin-3-ylcarbamoyl)methyl]-2-hydroxybutanedioate decarboxylase [Cryptosporangiaceae bacterium]|nr:2-[(L-alanin-3-ylcarbamoyl)methyl]-2-hydroxybutanedioate decarboxylase [Cryptosporangiaceae bacterium]
MQLPPSAGDLPALDPADLPAKVIDAVTSRGGDPDHPVSGYFYDLAAAVERTRGLKAALPPWAEVYYAVKANSYAPVLHALVGHVDGFEVASAREAELAASIRPGVKMVASGPGKSLPLLTALVRTGVGTINVESRLELHRVNAAAMAAGRRAAVAIRVNPQHVELSGSLRMGGTASQFGLPEAAVPDAMALARSLPAVDLVGFHIHAVCNNLDAEAHARYVRWCLDWSARTAHTHAMDLRVVDVGGGIGVPFGTEDPFDLHRFGALLAELRPPDGVRVLFEPGRYLVTECGYYAAEVTDVKASGGTIFAVVRGGINHFQIPTSWDLLHRFAIVPIGSWPHSYPRPGAEDVSLTVVGELCTPEDTLARDMKVARVRAGDVVVFPLAGSYGYEFAMPEFLGHPPATRSLI